MASLVPAYLAILFAAYLLCLHLYSQTKAERFLGAVHSEFELFLNTLNASNQYNLGAMDKDVSSWLKLYFYFYMASLYEVAMNTLWS